MMIQELPRKTLDEYKEKPWLSSTTISTRQLCPRKAVLREQKGADIDSPAIRWGSVIHEMLDAALTFCVEQGAVVPIDEEKLLRLMEELPPGDYGNCLEYINDDYGNSGTTYWRSCHARFTDIVNSDYFSRLVDRGAAAEYNVVNLGVTMGSGVLCRGHADIVYRREADGVLVVADWKSRGSLSWAPFSPEEFKEFPQTAYYACLFHHCDEVDTAGGIRVEHANILRESHGQEPVVYGTLYNNEYLDSVYRYFNRYFVPEFEEDLDSDHIVDVEPDRSACWAYNSECPFLNNGCPAASKRNEDSLAAFFGDVDMNPNSEQAPDEIEPTPVEETPLGNIPGVTARPETNLGKQGVYTLGDLVAFIMEHKKLTHISYIGAVSEKKIAAGAMSIWESFEDSTPEELEVLSELSG